MVSKSTKPKTVGKNGGPMTKHPGEGKGWRRGDSKYNWLDRFKQGSFILRRGVDYVVQTHGLVTTIRQMAAKLGKGVTIRINEDKKNTTIHVTVLPVPIRQQKVNQNPQRLKTNA